MRELRGWKRRGEAEKIKEVGGRERDSVARSEGWCGMGGAVRRG